MQEECKESPPRELHGKRLYGYSMGILGQFLPTGLLSAYLSIFYIYTIGLDAFLVGIGTALGYLTNAFCAQFFGFVSDQKRPGKWGKRRPFLLAGLPMLFISLIVLWTPPKTVPGETWDYRVAVYLWVFIVAFYMNFALIRSSYLALLPEQSQVEKNRIKASSIQGIFSIVSSILGIVLPMFLQSRLKDPQNAFYTTADGQFLLRVLPWLALAFGMVSIIFTVFTFVSVDESYYQTDPKYAHCLETKKKSSAEMFQAIMVPLKDPEYKKYLECTIAGNMSAAMLIKVLAPLAIFVLLLQGNEFNIFTIALIPFAAVGFGFWEKKAKVIGLKKTFIYSSILMGLILMSGVVLFIPIGKVAKIVIAFALVAALLFCMVAGYMLPNPTIGRLIDVAQAHSGEPGADGQLKNQKTNLSGSYYGSYLFSLNIANSMAELLMGAVMTGANARNPVILTLILPISAILIFISVLLFKRIKIQFQ